MTAQPKPGERWRVVLEGTVLAPRSDAGVMWLAATKPGVVGTDYAEMAIYDPLLVSAERLPDPEPDWRPGDVVRAADSRTWMYDGGNGRSCWYAFDGRAAQHDVPVRPLTRLVPEVKPGG